MDSSESNSMALGVEGVTALNKHGLLGVERLVVSFLAILLAAKPRLAHYPRWHIGSGISDSGYLFNLRKKFWRNLPFRCRIRWLDGLWLYIHPSDESSRVIFLTGLFEPNEFSLLDRILRSGMTFVDVGANMGLYTLFAAKKVGRSGTVLAIEPSRRELQRLTMNLEANALKNVRVLSLAVSNQRSEADLAIAAREHAGHNTLGAFGYDIVLERKERVLTDRLDDIIKEQGLSRLDVLKIDVEGTELRALQGAQQTLERFRPTLLLELSDRTLRGQGCNSAQVRAFLIQRGYRIHAFDPATGLPTPATPKPYSDGENVIAVHE